MARTGMTDLIRRLRLLTEGAAGLTTSLYTDDELEQVLDSNAVYVVREELLPQPGFESYTPVFISAHRQFESGGRFMLQTEDGAELIPDSVYTADYAMGMFTIVEEAWWDTPLLLLTGYSHDLYGAAADVLEMMSARWAGDFDFSADGATYNRSQRRTAFLALAAQYRARARTGAGSQGVQTVRMVRSDL